jgi:hypothetical protein
MCSDLNATPAKPSAAPDVTFRGSSLDASFAVDQPGAASHHAGAGMRRASIVPGETPLRVAQQRVTLMEKALASNHIRPAPARPAPIVRALRMLSLEDGSVFARWSDGVSMLMHPQATTLTHLLPDGTMCREVSALVGSAARGKLTELLAYRNMVCGSEQPVMDEDVWKGPVTKSASAFPFARWGLQPASALSITSPHGVDMSLVPDAPSVVCPAQHLKDGSVRIEALEGNIALTLLPNGHWVRLNYPLPLKRLVSGVTADGVMKYEYTYADFSQLFPVDGVPQTWSFPLRCALEAAAQAQEQELLHATMAGEGTVEIISTMPIQRNVHPHATPAHQAVSPIAPHSTFQLPSHLHHAEESFDLASPRPSSVLEDTLPEQPSLIAPPSGPSPSHFDLIMDLPVVRSLQPSSISGPSVKLPLARAFVEPCEPRRELWRKEKSDLSWPEKPGHSLSLLHSMEDALPSGSLVSSHWTPTALYFSFPDEEKVVVLIAEDQSALVLEKSGFFKHFLEPMAADVQQSTAEILANEARNELDEDQPRPLFSSPVPHQLNRTSLPVPGSVSRQKTYAPSGVPAYHNASGLTPGEKTYELASIARCAVRLQQHAKGIREEQALAAKMAERKIRQLKENQPGIELHESDLAALSIRKEDLLRSALGTELLDARPTFSASIHEKSVVRGLGEFTAFRDGRVKARFFDRCLIELNSSKTEANLLLPNGFPLHVSIPSMDAHTYSQYLNPSVQFSHWAFQTPAERLETQRRELLKDELVRLEVEQTKRFLRMKRIERGEEGVLTDLTNTMMSTQPVQTSVACTPVQQLEDRSSLAIRLEGVRSAYTNGAASVSTTTTSHSHQCTPSLLPSFVVHHATASTPASTVSPTRPFDLGTQNLTAREMPSFLSPIAHGGRLTHDGEQLQNTPSFLVSPSAGTSLSTPPPLPCFGSTPQAADLSFLLKDLQARNHAAQYRLSMQMVATTTTSTRTEFLTVPRSLPPTTVRSGGEYA